MHILLSFLPPSPPSTPALCSGCTYVFADGTTTTTLMDYAWFACQQNANGQYCWVDYWNFTNTALQVSVDCICPSRG